MVYNVKKISEQRQKATRGVHMTGSEVRAVYQDGVLRLLDPFELPNGTEVRILLQALSGILVVKQSPRQVADSERPSFVYPTRTVPAGVLDRLIGIVEVGGDALGDSEALYR